MRTTVLRGCDGNESLASGFEDSVDSVQRFSLHTNL